ncbi:methyltransferase domain-containing protein [Paraburkholderia sp. J94]|uniref:methyltransferase domain-containing protein n=1 Tax=Paraburkholderia sp. J94 TaxID=2805441 RepID=UPI002AAF1773|nr:methyltransferase domain-containing protein [Paraburkholderia sp. J94]
MNRREQILKYIDKDQLGIEIGPYWSPLTPKREGYNCLVMDVFDTQTTRGRAAENPTLSAENTAKIEEVDLVGSCTHIDQIVEQAGRLGEFDYIVSSHNFEHLPNPIRFLQGCAKVLKPGGVISMAIPDHRACYDYFRPVTRLSDWLDAWLHDRSRPTFAQAFDDQWVRAAYDHHGVPHGSFFQGVDPDLVSAATTLEKEFSEWKARMASQDAAYHDAHCSVFTPSSLELLLRDSAYLGLIQFEVVEISSSPGVDIFIHLRRSSSVDALHPADYPKNRNTLLHRILDEGADASTLGKKNRRTDFDQIETQIDVARNESDIYRSALEDVRAELGQSYRDLHAGQDEINRLRDALAAVKGSTSWRLTAPIRSLKRVCNRLRQAT